MDGWKDVLMDGWIFDWMGGWMEGWIDCPFLLTPIYPNSGHRHHPLHNDVDTAVYGDAS